MDEMDADLAQPEADGLVAGEAKVPTASGPIPAYRAYPAGKAGAPTVLVIHGISGLREPIRDIVRRLGCYAIAPDLYVRGGDVAKDAWARMIAWFRAHGVA